MFWDQLFLVFNQILNQRLLKHTFLWAFQIEMNIFEDFNIEKYRKQCIGMTFFDY